ncbi:MAG: hypothetical protein AAFR84_21525 [Pseudomonadota bacterium]
MRRISDRPVKDLVAARCINPLEIFLSRTPSFQQPSQHPDLGVARLLVG